MRSEIFRCKPARKLPVAALIPRQIIKQRSGPEATRLPNGASSIASRYPCSTKCRSRAGVRGLWSSGPVPELAPRRMLNGPASGKPRLLPACAALFHDQIENFARLGNPPRCCSWRLPAPCIPGEGTKRYAAHPCGRAIGNGEQLAFLVLRRLFKVLTCR